MESHQKEDFEVEVFSPLRILTSPLFEETLGVFLFLHLLFSFFFFLNTFSLFFCAPSLGVFDDIYGEKSFLQKFLFK
jgi:hypothetical protein